MIIEIEEALPIDGKLPEKLNGNRPCFCEKLKGGLSYNSNQESNDRQHDHYDFIITHQISPPFVRSVGYKRKLYRLPFIAVPDR